MNWYELLPNLIISSADAALQDGKRVYVANIGTSKTEQTEAE